MGQKADHRRCRRGSAAEEVQQRKCSRGGSRGGAAEEKEERRRKRRRTAYLNHKTTHRGSGKIINSGKYPKWLCEEKVNTVY